ncbi:hypothetical protein VTJ49DRAFT_650 [Mycothermus thermophilus]|uniref:Uncharacterized protein n=1 Tax=Humicola insolens TaxID=85995 RepID=A0ABR3VFI7_HUMIN
MPPGRFERTEPAGGDRGAGEEWDSRHEIDERPEDEVFNGGHLGDRGDLPGNSEHSVGTSNPSYQSIFDIADNPVNLDILPRADGDVLFPQGKTSNEISRHRTDAMQKSNSNFTFNKVVSNLKSRHETLDTQRVIAKGQLSYFKDIKLEDFKPRQCQVETSDGLVTIGDVTMDGEAPPDANAFMKFYGTVGKIRFPNETIATNRGGSSHRVKSPEELASLSKMEMEENRAKRLKITIEALRVAENAADAEINRSAKKSRDLIAKMEQGGEVVQWQS